MLLYKNEQRLNTAIPQCRCVTQIHRRWRGKRAHYGPIGTMNWKCESKAKQNNNRGLSYSEFHLLSPSNGYK
jgi:hypothetical protein